MRGIPGTLFSAAVGAMVLGGLLAAGAAAADKQEKVLRHVVLFQFKSSVTKEQVQEVEEAFAQLPKKIPAILEFEFGTDVGVENLSQGFTHCFLVTFRDAKGRDEYLPHAAHKEFVDLVKPRLEKVLVVDYWTAR